MPTQSNEVVVTNLETIISEVIEEVLNGIHQAFPIATQYDDDTVSRRLVVAYQTLSHFVTVAIREFSNENEPDKYEFALDAIKDKTTELVKWYSNLKPNYQSR